jgi:hypothetical protein
MPVFAHIMLYALYLAGMLWVIFKWQYFNFAFVSRKQLAALFILKVIAGVTLTLIYTYYYTDRTRADIYRYFDDSVVISKVLFKDPVAWLKIITGIGINDKGVFQYFEPTMYFTHPSVDRSTDNALLIRLCSVLNYASWCNIYINTLFFNFICFTGLVAMLKAFSRYFEDRAKLLLIPLFLFPSVVFWSSGLLKEQLLLALIGFYIFIHNRVIFKTEVVTWLAMALILWMVYAVKPSVAACLLVSSVFLPGFKVNQTRQMIAAILAASLLLMIGISLNWHYRLCELIINKRNEFVQLAFSEHVGSYFDARILKAGCADFFKLIPGAMVNAVFRPFVWDAGNKFQVFFAIENAVFILGISYLLIRYFKFPAGEKRLLFLFCLTFAISNYFIIGITVPIMGAIVHYRVIAAPFLLLAALLATERIAVKTL